MPSDQAETLVYARFNLSKLTVTVETFAVSPSVSKFVLSLLAAPACNRVSDIALKPAPLLLTCVITAVGAAP